MPPALQKIACVDVVPEELKSFCGWLNRNRRHIIGISEYAGCGCCVDVFELVVDAEAEPTPSESAGNFNADAVRYGAERDRILDGYLSWRGG